MSGAPIQVVMAAVMANVSAVDKDGFNREQGFAFRSADAVINAVSPALKAHGVVVVPKVESVTYEMVTTQRGGNKTMCRLVATYRFFGPAGDFLDAIVAAEAMDMGDKATAKAMTVAFRIALLQVLALPTNDPDPDAASYDDQPAAAAAPAQPAPTVSLADALDAASTTEDMRTIYREHVVSRADGATRDAFNARLAAIQSAEKEAAK